MAVKRVTIELDDAADIVGSTTHPTLLVGSKNRLPNVYQQTATPDTQDDYGQPEALGENTAKVPLVETIGRTPSDLVVTFINRPEFIATALTVLAFLICVGKLQQAKDFWIPISTAAFFNGVWFSVYSVRGIIRWLRNRKNESFT